MNAFELTRSYIEAGAAGARTYVSNGAETDGQDVRIVDPETLQTLPEGRVGEIWVGGEEIAWGYWGNEAATAATFRAVPADGAEDVAREGPFLRTGDLGFLQDGHLYVTGRLKDMMILRGQCHYPNDLEASLVGAHPAIVGGAAAAFTIQDEGEGFDHEAFLTGPPAGGGYRGRGITLARTLSFSSLTYMGSGSVVEAVILLDGPAG